MNMKRISVSSTIDEGVYFRWKKSGLKLNHVINLGLMSAESTPGYLSRIRELETGNDKLQKQVSRLYQRLVSLGADKDL
jgi:hypothetical protein